MVQICYTSQKTEDSEKANRRQRWGEKKLATSTIDRENTEQQSETEHDRGESDEDQKRGRWLRE